MWKSAGRTPSLRVLPWHLPYNWGKSMEKPQSCHYTSTFSTSLSTANPENSSPEYPSQYCAQTKSLFTPLKEYRHPSVYLTSESESALRNY